MSVPETICTAKAVGISVDINTYEPHLLAGTMAHMIGHNVGMGHDDNSEWIKLCYRLISRINLYSTITGEECFCRDWHGCIMSQSIVGLENVQPYKFSECSRSDYIDALRNGHGLCLLNKPNEVSDEQICTRFKNLFELWCEHSLKCAEIAEMELLKTERNVIADLSTIAARKIHAAIQSHVSLLKKLNALPDHAARIVR